MRGSPCGSPRRANRLPPEREIRNRDGPSQATVSLPDDRVEKIKHAAGGERQVSSYVARALEDYQERERLDEILAVALYGRLQVGTELQRHLDVAIEL